MLFKDIIGQSRIKQQLITAVNENRVSHAQLFLGPEGCGNLAMALAFAQYINCENKTEDDSCGKCSSCLKAQKFIHPDIHYTFPFIFSKEDKKELCADWLTEWREFLHKTPYGSYNEWIKSISSDNKQGNINVKECSDLLRRLSFKNFESPYKVQILWLPEFLGNEGNRLLKIIEEPYDNTLFLLVAIDQERIINTIMSRVQIVKFNRLSDEQMVIALQSKFALEPYQAKKIAAMSEGNFNAATLFVEIHEDLNTAMVRDWMEAAYRKNIKSLFAWNDKFLKLGREQQKNFFQYCLHFFREILLIEAGAAEISKLTDEELKTAQGLGKTLGIDRITQILELFDKSIYFVERNVNARILITYISITLLKQFKTDTINQRPFFEKWAF